MKKTILPLLFMTLLGSAHAADLPDVAEEGIILNQELQFLEESVNARPTPSPTVEKTEFTASRSGSLEDTYFGRDGEDTVRSRAAAPRRRGTD